VEEELEASTATLHQCKELIETALRLMDDVHRSYVHADEEARKRYKSAFVKKLIVKDQQIVRAAWEEPFATLLSLGESSSKDTLHGASRARTGDLLGAIHEQRSGALSRYVALLLLCRHFFLLAGPSVLRRSQPFTFEVWQEWDNLRCHDRQRCGPKLVPL